MYENLKDHALSFIKGSADEPNRPDDDPLAVATPELSEIGRTTGFIGAFLIVWLFAPGLISAIAMMGMIVLAACMLINLIPGLPAPQEEKHISYILGAAFPFICIAFMGLIWLVQTLLEAN